jgi:transcriptional regulator NrdR family protein
MNCKNPLCNYPRTLVAETKHCHNGEIWRRRQCPKCNCRYTTREMSAHVKIGRPKNTAIFKDELHACA